MPGSGQFLLHAPRYPQVSIVLENGKTLTIQAPGAKAGAPQYVSAVSVDGAPHRQTWVDYAQLRDGGVLGFTLTGEAPRAGWGTGADDAPMPVCAANR